jgi:hypothetical protein
VPVKDLAGQRFGKIRVINRAPSGSRWQTRWNCICDCGNAKVMQASNLTTGKSKSCGCESEKARYTNNAKAKLSEKQVREKCNKHGFDYLRGFNGIQKKAWFRCQECEHEFAMKAEKVIYGVNQCPQCSIGSHGYLNEKFFDERPELRDIPCTVYLLKLRNKDEEFWKIGITRRTVAKRMYQIPYELVESETVETTFWNAYLLEKDFKRAIKRYRYTPAIDFGGWTECFSPPHKRTRPVGA